MAAKTEPDVIWYEGTTYIYLYLLGVLQSTAYKISGSSLKMTVKSEGVDIISKDRDEWGNIVETIPGVVDAQIAISLKRFTKILGALIFLGEETTVNQPAETGITGSITAVHDEFVTVNKRNLRNVLITGSEEGVDFIVNTRMGHIKIISTGNIIDGATVNFTAETFSRTFSNIKGGSKSKNDIKLEFDGINRGTRADAMITIQKMSLISDSEIDFLSDEVVEASLTGKMLKVEGFPLFDLDTDIVNSDS